jgi:hypothetical protein
MISPLAFIQEVKMACPAGAATPALAFKLKMGAKAMHNKHLEPADGP